MRIFESTTDPSESAHFPPSAILDRHFGPDILNQGNWASVCLCTPILDFKADMPVSLFHVFYQSSCKITNNFVVKKLDKSTHLNLLLLLLSGDINTNPGPYQPKYPCGICSKAEKWKQQAIECEECSVWYHKECMGMNDEIFEVLQNHASYNWICCSCGLPNFASSIFDFTDSFELSNQFEPLSSSSNIGTGINDPLDFNTTTSDGSRPISTSSPKPNASGKPTPRTSNKRKLKSKPLKVLNVNCQSVKAKRDQFLTILEIESPDIIVGTESWLNTEMTTGEIFPSNFQVFRKDRAGDSHGGVFIAVNDNLIATEEPNLATDSESIWISIHVKGITPMYVGSFYRSQATDADYIKLLDSALSKIPPQASIWLLGDFNLPDVDWENFKFKPGGSYAGPSKAMIDVALDYNLLQQVKEPTRLNNILDLCFTNSPSFVSSTEVIPGVSDHDAVVVNISMKPKLIRPVKRKIYLYKKADFTSMEECIRVFDNKLSPEYLRSKTVDELVNEFNQLIMNAMNEFIPSKVTSSRWKLPWINSTIKRNINKKKRLYKKAKKISSAADWQRFKLLRRSTDREIRKAKNEYMEDIIGGFLQTNNTKPFWNYIKSIRQEVFGIPTLSVDNVDLTLPREKANALNEQFSSVFTKEDLTSFPDVEDSGIPDLPDFAINPVGVGKLLREINPNKASGPDAVPAKILKECAGSLAPVLTKIYQKSLDSGYVPLLWREANVTPLYKKGDRSNV